MIYKGNNITLKITKVKDHCRRFTRSENQNHLWFGLELKYKGTDFTDHAKSTTILHTKNRKTTRLDEKSQNSECAGRLQYS